MSKPPVMEYRATGLAAAQRPDYDAPQLQRRELVTRATADADQREISGIGVPYEQETELVPGFFESWARGAVVMPEDGTKLFWRHTEPIGRVIEAQDQPEGWAPRARVSRTARGDEALTLVDDEVITRMSVGFRPLEWEKREDEDGLHVTITRAVVHEVSLVPFPAFEGATITGRREAAEPAPSPITTTPREDRTMDTETTTTRDEAVAELRTAIDELRQEIATRQAPADEDHPALQFRSHGEFARALARGDERATAAFTRAVTTAETVTRDSWVGNAFRLIEERQRITRAFTHVANLPSEGNNVEYGVLIDNTTQVTEQAAELDDLAYGQVEVGTATAPVKTFGGYTSLSRQAIERSSIETLDLNMQAMVIAYARGIELNTRAVLDAAIAAGTPADTTVDLATATAGTWLDVLLDGEERLDDASMSLQGLVVSRSVFRHLAGLDAEDKLLKWVGTPDGHGGTLQVTGGARGTVAQVPVIINPSWSGQDKAAMFDPFAIVTREAPGAPFRLQDDNIINLSRDFSVYGYAASYTQAPGAIVPVTITNGGA